jgi:hypothetical protein
MADMKKMPPMKAALKSIFDFPNTLVLSDKELPAIKDWIVGEKYTITLEVEQTSMRKKEDGSMCAEFKINSASSNDESEEENDQEEGDEPKMKTGGKVSKTIVPKLNGKATKLAKTGKSDAKSTKATPKSDKRTIDQYDMYS